MIVSFAHCGRTRLRKYPPGTEQSLFQFGNAINGGHLARHWSNRSWGIYRNQFLNKFWEGKKGLGCRIGLRFEPITDTINRCFQKRVENWAGETKSGLVRRRGKGNQSREPLQGRQNWTPLRLTGQTSAQCRSLRLFRNISRPDQYHIWMRITRQFAFLGVFFP